METSKSSLEKSDEEHVCLKVSDEENRYEETNISYNKLFKLNVKLIKENGNLENSNVEHK